MYKNEEKGSRKMTMGREEHGLEKKMKRKTEGNDPIE